MKYIMCFLITVSFLSCSDDCLTCTKDTDSFEICNDGELNYTNFEGEVISYEEAIELQRSIGYICE